MYIYSVYLQDVYLKMVHIYRMVLITRVSLRRKLSVLLFASHPQKQSGAEGWGIGSEGLPTKMPSLSSLYHPLNIQTALHAFCELSLCQHSRNGRLRELPWNLLAHINF